MSSKCSVEDNSLTCFFPADTSHVEKVLQQLAHIPFLADRERVFFDLSLVLREALNNAIVHGADQDRSMEIECRVSVDSGGIDIVVVSPGHGFDWEKCLEKQLPECPTQSGWGVFLIREYTDHLVFRDQGKRLECRINLDRYQEKDRQQF